MSRRGGRDSVFNAATYRPHSNSGSTKPCKDCKHTPLVYRAYDDTSDVQTSTVPISNASMSVSELPYDTDQCCNSGSHWDVGECTACLVTNEFGDSVVTSCDVCDDVLYIIKHSSTIIQPTHTPPANIVFNSTPISVGALWDTDALLGSYMSTRVAKLLEEVG